MKTDGRYEAMTKKERTRLDREQEGLERNLSGIRSMGSLPDVMFVIDSNKEEIAVKEANRLGIPIVSIVDTNCDPDLIDYVVPGNDDALRAIRLFLQKMADAILEGREMAKDQGVLAEAEAAQAETEGQRDRDAARPPRNDRRDDRRGPRRDDRGPRRDDRGPRRDERPAAAAPTGDDVRAYRSADGRPEPQAAEPAAAPAPAPATADQQG